MANEDSAPFRALLVGVWTYGPDSEFDSLRGPQNDLNQLGTVLRDPPSGRYAVSELQNPTTGELLVTVQNFLQGAGEQDNLLLYYTGHGDLSINDGQLCLTSREGQRETLDGSSLRFDMLHSWIKASRARSVTLILDCCKAGRAFKTSEPDISSFLKQDLKNLDALNGSRIVAPPKSGKRSSAKAVNVLAAVPGYSDTPDADEHSGMSPFTADLCTALRSGAQANESGEVSLATVVRYLCAQADEKGRAMPYLWGAYGGANTYVAIRPSFLEDNLSRAGLAPLKLQRSGAAKWRGEDLHIVLAPARQIADHVVKHHPTLASIGGNVSRGKTWTLCDVRDELTERGFHVVTLAPSVEVPDPDRLRLALKRYISSQADERPVSVIVDGIEWSTEWADFVEGLGELLRFDSDPGKGISMVMALESSTSEIRSVWKLPPGMHMPGVDTADFIAQLLSPSRFPSVAAWDPARLESVRSDLLKSAGAGLWAAAHMAPVLAEGQSEEEVFRALWEEQIGPVSRRQMRALQLVAALGRYNLWCPLTFAIESGDVLVRLGAEFSRSKDALRLNGGLQSRAILIRRETNGRVIFERGTTAADRVARPIVKRYIRDTLLDPDQQHEAVYALNRLRLRRHIFAPVIDYLSERDRKGATSWQIWANHWNDLSTATRVLDIVRTLLPPAVANDLENHLAQYVLDDRCTTTELPTVVAALEVLHRYNRARGRRVSRTDQAIDLLVERAVARLKEARGSAQVRRRLLKVLRQTNRLNSAILEDAGADLLRPASPALLADLVLILDFPNLVSSVMKRAQALELISRWPVVVDEVVVHPEQAERSADLAVLAARTALAAQVADESTGDRLRGQLAARLRVASARDVQEVLSVLLRSNRKLAALMAGAMDVDTWSGGKYQRATAQEVADLLGTLSRVSPHLALRSLYRNGAADDALSEFLAEELRSCGDAVAASKLLKISARVEEQTGHAENGFAGQLARSLGEQFLVNAVRGDSRFTVLGHLIDGYVAAHSPSLEASREDAEDIIEELICFAASGNGPRIALNLAEDHVLGLSVVDDLKARGNLPFNLIMSRMTESVYASDLAPYHTLAPLLFPGIEKQFADWVAESGMEWSENLLFQNVANEGNVLTSLRAADAVAATLARSGVPAPGKELVAAFQRSYKGLNASSKWSNRVLSADSSDSAECLQLLRRLDVEEAESIVASGRSRIGRVLAQATPTVFAAILNAVSQISSDVAGELVDSCIRSGLCEEKISDLEAESDLFQQADCLLQLAKVEDRIFVRIVDPDRLASFQAVWKEDAAVIRNPEILAKFVDVLGVRGRDQAMHIVRAISPRGLESRLAHRNRSDIAGFAHLLELLSALDPDAVREVVSFDDASWLLLTAQVGRVEALVNSLTNCGIVDAERCAQLLGSRLTLELKKSWIRDETRFWLGIGWLARALRLKGVSLQSSTGINVAVPEHLPFWASLWTATWAPSWPGASEAAISAVARLNRCLSPPHLSWQAAACLVSLVELSTRDELEVPKTVSEGLSAWDHALRASTNWAAALVHEMAASDEFRTAAQTYWSRWGLRRLHASLAWTSQGWRPVPLEAVRVFDTLWQ